MIVLIIAGHFLCFCGDYDCGDPIFSIEFLLLSELDINFCLNILLYDVDVAGNEAVPKRGPAPKPSAAAEVKVTEAPSSRDISAPQKDKSRNQELEETTEEEDEENDWGDQDWGNMEVTIMMFCSTYLC